MTTQKFIDENKTETFKKGDTVVMHTCGEAAFYKGKIWTCQTDSYKRGSVDYGFDDLVFLEGFSGAFATKFLAAVGGEK